MMERVQIETCEMHTGGEPLRIVTKGYPEIKGDTILDKRRYCKDNLDHFRKLLMFEPRGHYDMYGAILVSPDEGIDADIGVLFTHNEGYSVMCGHATIALSRYVVDKGLIAKSRLKSPETTVHIQCPCGVVKSRVEYDGHKTGKARFDSVPSFVHALDIKVDVKGFGIVNVDISFGGTFYAILPAQALGLDFRKSRVSDLADAAQAITVALRQSYKLDHPDSSDLAFMYGTILTDGQTGDCMSNPSANICVFADKAVDRSPTGSGVTARMALQYHRKLVKKDQECCFESVTKSRFTGKVVGELKTGKYDAVTVEIGGHGYYSGTATFTVDPDDPQAPGFLLH